MDEAWETFDKVGALNECFVSWVFGQSFFDYGRGCFKLTQAALGLAGEALTPAARTRAEAAKVFMMICVCKLRVFVKERKTLESKERL